MSAGGDVRLSRRLGMQFTRFGITLARLESQDLEMVRQWRNSSWVRPYMRFRELIAPHQQAQWFEGLHPDCNLYFLARTQDVPFALFNLKEIDWAARSAEAGGFVGEPAFIGRSHPGQATLALMDFAFLLLSLQSLRARYSRNLPRIVRFNQQLGYIPLQDDEEGFVCSCVTAQRYLTSAALLRKAAMTIHGTSAIVAAPDAWLIPHLQRRWAEPLPDFELEVQSQPYKPS